MSQTSNCMSCTVLHCLLLPHPHRTRLLQLLFRQSTPLPRARPLTRWRGHLQQVVLVPTQDLLLNLWPTLLNSTPRARRGMPVHPSHRMGRWMNKRYYHWNRNVTNVVLMAFFLTSHYSCFKLKKKIMPLGIFKEFSPISAAVWCQSEVTDFFTFSFRAC